jgi:Polyketide cyclase / dehydrase and lipid transport
MTTDRYPLHHRSEVDVDADAHSLFAHLDDHRRLASHMEKPSLMMAGATMRVETDALQGQAVGSLIRVTGRVLGVNLAVEEMVIERVPPMRKTWETRGKPRLLVIGSYRMGFTISPQGARSRLVVFIDYQLPPRGFARALALLFGRAYAAWCTRRMATDAVAAFGGVTAS